MERKTLGTSSLQVTSLGLGCMPLSGVYGSVTRDKALEVLRAAVDRGINLFDTANYYGAGENERLLSELIRTCQSQVHIATKFGIVYNSEGRVLGVDGTPRNARASCEASLKRLGTETIDLFYLHRPDPDVPIEDTVGEMRRLREEGKIKCLGLSEISESDYLRALKVAHIAAVQSEYSVWSRDIEKNGFLATLEKNKTTFFAFSPLGRGFFTGRVNSLFVGDGDIRKFFPRFSLENHFSANLKVVEEFSSMAATKSVSAAQLALGWLLHKAPHVVPIPGTRKVEHLDENIASCRIKLSENEMAAIDQLSHRFSGSRHPTLS